ncbi:hypothetical protein A0H81_05655 [Grifola frondosa]|uniref:Uncharacterized protein n=1 Tax=Grifola frondosa TaxID=5627 RepID=A0A1C7MI39_GRIFR|nr:hypothetical protein A0H81_05655 [Grifola frondosa]
MAPCAFITLGTQGDILSLQAPPSRTQCPEFILPTIWHAGLLAARHCTTLLLRLLCDPTAVDLTDGASNFTPAEFAWLQEQYVTDDVRNILETGGHGKRRQAANLLTARYTLHFAALLPPETTEEFTKRKAWKTIAARDAMAPRVEETEPERVERLTKAPTRIYNWVKSHSERRQRHPEGPKIAPIPTGRSPRKKTAWDIYKAEHPDTAEVPVITAPDGSRRADIGTFQKTVHSQFTQLPEEIKAKYEAKARELEVDDANEAESSGLRAEALRAAKARQLPDYIKSSLAHWQKETGYIFFCYACRIDEFGQLSAFSSSEEETPGPVFPLGPEAVETIAHMVVNGSAMTLIPEAVRSTNAMEAEINEASGSAQEASPQDPGGTEIVSRPGEATFTSEDAPPSDAEPLPCPSPVRSRKSVKAKREAAALRTRKARGKKQMATKKQAATEGGQQVAPSRVMKKANGDPPPSVAPAETADMPVQVSTVATVESSQATGTGRSQRQRTHSAKAMGHGLRKSAGYKTRGRTKSRPANAKELKRARKNETGRGTNKRVKGAVILGVHACLYFACAADEGRGGKGYSGTLRNLVAQFANKNLPPKPLLCRTCHGFGPENFKMVLHYKVGIAGRWGALCLNCHHMAYPDQAQLTDIEVDLIERQRREDEVLAQLEKDHKMAERLQRRVDAEMARDQKRADESTERLEMTASQLASMQASHEVGDSGTGKIARRVGRTARKSSGGKRPKRFLDDDGRKERSEDGSGDKHGRKRGGGAKDPNIDGKADEDIDVVLLRIVIWYDENKAPLIWMGTVPRVGFTLVGLLGWVRLARLECDFGCFFKRWTPEEDICDWRGPLIWHDTLIVPEEGMRSLLLKRSFITQCPGIKWELRALLTGEFGPDGGPIID